MTTPFLHRIAASGQADRVLDALNAGHDIRARDADGSTALHWGWEILFVFVDSCEIHWCFFV